MNIAGIGTLLYTLPPTTEDGLVIIEHTEPLVDRLVAVSQENESVYKFLMLMCTGSVWGALVIECAVITAAILSNHGVVIPLPGMKKTMTDEQFQKREEEIAKEMEELHGYSVRDGAFLEAYDELKKQYPPETAKIMAEEYASKYA